jgi:3D (Asp-Asp-Asp) domain-containing protein
MKRMTQFALEALATLLVLWSSISQGSAQEIVSSYVTFFGFDDNDDGNPTHLGTAIISNASLHGFANEDLGTYEKPGTLATDKNFLAPGTKVYVPALERYYVMEDTCVECSEDWAQNKPHIDLYVSGTGPELAACENRLTMQSTKIIIDPSPDLPVKPGSACNSGVGG